MDWYIGQDIVAIKNHSQGAFKEGDVFTIKGLRGSQCQCNKIQIDIGKTKDSEKQCCGRCGASWINDTSAWWFDEIIFTPLDSLVNNDEIQNLIEESLYQLK